MIDQATIDRIVETADIVDVVGDFVTLKRRGANYLGLCPFHNEKTPSFSVSPSRGIYKCFGCSKGGNSANFIMEHEHLSWPEALKYLAKKYNIEIRETEQTPEMIAQETERESLLIVSEFAQKYFTEILNNNRDGQAIGYSYLKQRSISDPLIKKFQLGYSTDEKDAFTNHAIKNGYNLEFLVKTGLTIQKEDWKIDRFGGRIIFPVHNVTGRVIAFGGRTLKTDKSVAKYLNSPESEIYVKSKVLYGLFFAKKSIIENDKCFLVEGYTDVISMHQAGIENTVASSGTSLTTDQIRLIKRFTNNITVLYDGDLAGIKASMRGIDMILEEGMDVKVLLFPDGEDPDSYSHKLSSSEFIEYIKVNETDFISFKAKLLVADAKNDPIKKTSLIKEIVESVSIISDAIKRSVYIRECSNIMEIDEQVLYTEVNKLRGKNRLQKAEEKTKTDKIAAEEFNEQKLLPAYTFEDEERELIRLLLFYGNIELPKVEIPGEEPTDTGVTDSVAKYIIRQVLNDELEFTIPVYKKIFDSCHQLLMDSIEPETKFFVNHPDNNVAHATATILSKIYPLSKIHAAGGAFVESELQKLKEIVPKTVFEYKSKVISVKLKEIQLKMKKAQDDKNFELFEELQTNFITYTELKKKVAKLLGGRTIY